MDRIGGVLKTMLEALVETSGAMNPPTVSVDTFANPVPDTVMVFPPSHEEVRFEARVGVPPVTVSETARLNPSGSKKMYTLYWPEVRVEVSQITLAPEIVKESWPGTPMTLLAESSLEMYTREGVRVMKLV